MAMACTLSASASVVCLLSKAQYMESGDHSNTDQEFILHCFSMLMLFFFFSFNSTLLFSPFFFPFPFPFVLSKRSSPSHLNSYLFIYLFFFFYPWSMGSCTHQYVTGVRCHTIGATAFARLLAGMYGANTTFFCVNAC